MGSGGPGGGRAIHADGARRKRDLPVGRVLDELLALRAPTPEPVLVQRIGERLRRFLEPTVWLASHFFIPRLASLPYLRAR